ncbi:MAG: hypothetical protein KAR19_07055 [Bacteroidales bacterium]|nr:hypothetical protein [Bacteroidales bacterium]
MKNYVNLKLTVLAFVMAVFTIQLSGQGPGMGPGRQMSEEDIKERIEDLSDTLKLSEEQHGKILEYELEFYNKRQVERQKFAGDREAMRAAMMEAREERDKKYAEVLTKVQMEKFKEIQEQRRSQMRRLYQENNSGSDDERPARGRGRN